MASSHRGKVTELTPDLPFGVSSVPSAVNDHGDVVGVVNGLPAMYQYTGFRWSGGNLALVPAGPGVSSFNADIDRRGRVLVNRTDGGSNRTSVIHHAREVTSPDVLDGRPLTGVAINDRRQVIGIAEDADHWNRRSYLWRPGDPPVDPGTFGGEPPTSTNATEINNAGSVLGTWSRVVNNTVISSRSSRCPTRC